MKCLICARDSKYFFSKIYSEQPFDEFMKEIGPVHYYKCLHCGFVLSKTHAELDDRKWAALNSRFHAFIEDPSNEKKGNQPPYAEQALMLNFLSRLKIIDVKSIIDYAAGYGTLSHLLAKYFDLELPIFDEYVTKGIGSRYVPASDLKTYATVFNSAMFEHIVNRDDLERVHRLVNRDGCLIIHTVVCENVPKDPDWFYLRPPVHTAFHTNKSMEILMSQWGYSSSIYSPKSKCWVLLRKDVQHIERLIADLNQELQEKWFFCKTGFVDYWKGF